MGRSLAAPVPKKKTNASSVTSTPRARVTGNSVPKRRDFSKEDDGVIIKLHSLLGDEWSKITEFFPGRKEREIKNHWHIHIKRKPYSREIDPHTLQPLNAATATDTVALVNSNNNNNNGFSQREICDPPIGDGGSATVHVASNRATRALNAVKKEDAASGNSISESTNFSKWEKVKSLGDGGFGIVDVIRDSETGDLCAVKKIKDIHKLGHPESLQKEIEILSRLKHKNVVKYYGHKIVGRHISLYMEYIQTGSLTKYILKKRGLPEHLIRNFTRQILFGLAYLHSKGIVHRDIKPDNLLVDSNEIVKLVDFGLAKQLQKSVGEHSVSGTIYYAAPESSVEASAADIWSLGCVIIAMFSGKHPWLGCEPVNVIYKVLFKQQHPPIPKNLCKDGKDFLELCFTRTPADRPSTATLLEHPFVKAQTT